MPCNICKVHSIELIDVIDLGRCDADIIAVNCALNVHCMIVGVATHYFLMAVRRDKGFELEVTDPQEEQG